MNLENIAPGFTAVDKSSDPDFYLNFLTAVEAFEDTKSIKQTMTAVAGIKEGNSCLDIGCGHGTEVLAWAKATGSKGRAVGIDPSASMIEAARKRAVALGLKAEFEVGDVHELQFGDNSFDACRAERVFMYLKDPEKALRELIRVTKPGGRVVIFDFDWDCAFIDGADPAVSRKFIRFMSDSFPKGKIGSQLHRLFVKAGLKEVESTPHAMRYPFEFCKRLITGNLGDAVKAGAVTDNEARDFWFKLESANAKGQYFAGVLGFIIHGRK